ncbi:MULTISPECIES: ABC transporter permease subunit [Salinibaculum]|uniref:ABC transporter permease subunit n=1 Tax=Salinibaculum TaxID=2732368 RepID=UPI0030D39B6D
MTSTLDVLAFESWRRVRSVLVLSAVLGLLALLTVGLFPTLEGASEALETALDSLPEETRRAVVGNVDTITTIEGYLVSQFYQFAWLLLLGVYYAYAGASLVAGEVEHGSIEFLLIVPLSRSSIVVGKFLALLPSILAVNVLTMAIVDLSLVSIGETVDQVHLAMVHGFSIPYLLACAGVGLLVSVRFDETRRAQTLAIGAIFAMFIVDNLTFDTDFEWLGAVAFSRYYDPGELLVDGVVDLADVAALVVAVVACVVVAAELFERRDIAT